MFFHGNFSVKPYCLGLAISYKIFPCVSLRFLRIGIVTTESQTEKEDLAKLLRFESSKEEKGTLVSLDQYIERAPESQKQVNQIRFLISYFLCSKLHIFDPDNVENFLVSPQLSCLIRWYIPQVYYLSAPSREMAMESPYFETLQQNDLEVLFTYNKEDDVVLFRLENYKDRKLCTAEGANVKPVEKPDEPG